MLYGKVGIVFFPVELSFKAEFSHDHLEASDEEMY